MAKRRLIDLDEIKPIDFPSIEMDGLDAVRYLNTLPTVDAVEMVHGRWIQDGIYNCCSACNKLTMMPHLKGLQKFNYCPNCGAKMDGVSDG